MSKIYLASLQLTQTTNIEGNYCEWQWSEVQEAEYGEEWNGDVIGYVENLDLDENTLINGIYNGSIHNLPENAVILVNEAEPIEIYWCE